MNKFLIATFLCITTSLASSEECPISYAKEKIRDIDFALDTYYIDGVVYERDFNFHVGYLIGQRDAYQRMIKKIK